MLKKLHLKVKCSQVVVISLLVIIINNSSYPFLRWNKFAKRAHFICDSASEIIVVNINKTRAVDPLKNVDDMNYVRFQIDSNIDSDFVGNSVSYHKNDTFERVYLKRVRYGKSDYSTFDSCIIITCTLTIASREYEIPFLRKLGLDNYTRHSKKTAADAIDSIRLLDSNVVLEQTGEVEANVNHIEETGSDSAALSISDNKRKGENRKPVNIVLDTTPVYSLDDISYLVHEFYINNENSYSSQVDNEENIDSLIFKPVDSSTIGE